MSGRSYGQHCGLAAALDVVGQRWAMLVIRELSAGARHFSELARSLPGLSSALLSRRLHELQEAGLVQHEWGDRGAYRLTDEGRELGPALAALGAWGGRRLAPASAEPAGDAPVRDPVWTLQTLAAGISSHGRGRGSSVVNVEVDGQWYHLAHGGAAARRGAHPESQASVRIDHDALESLRAGAATLEDLAGDGRAVVRGDRRAARHALRLER